MFPFPSTANVQAWPTPIMFISPVDITPPVVNPEINENTGLGEFNENSGAAETNAQ